MSSGLDVFLWVVVPYICLTVFVLGHLWRYRYDKFGWTTRSSQMYENRLLRLGSPLFHFGILFVLLGHVMGLGVPKPWTEAVGMSEGLYHFMAVSVGTVAGVCTVVGMVILIYRRRTVGPVFSATTRMDKAMYAVLATVILLGLANTVVANVFGHYDYREGVSIWFRGIFRFSLHPELMAAAPIGFQLHGLAAFALFALWPFTRLVHVLQRPARLPDQAVHRLPEPGRPARQHGPQTWMGERPVAATPHPVAPTHFVLGTRHSGASSAGGRRLTGTKSVRSPVPGHPGCPGAGGHEATTARPPPSARARRAVTTTRVSTMASAIRTNAAVQAGGPGDLVGEGELPHAAGGPAGGGLGERHPATDHGQPQDGVPGGRVGDQRPVAVVTDPHQGAGSHPERHAGERTDQLQPTIASGGGDVAQEGRAGDRDQDERQEQPLGGDPPGAQVGQEHERQERGVQDELGCRHALSSNEIRDQGRRSAGDCHDATAGGSAGLVGARVDLRRRGLHPGVEAALGDGSVRG